MKSELVRFFEATKCYIGAQRQYSFILCEANEKRANLFFAILLPYY